MKGIKKAGVAIIFRLSAGFAHKTNPQNIDLNCIRLAFQVFLEGNEKGAFTFALKPVVSDPIYDKSEFDFYLSLSLIVPHSEAKCDLTICRLTETSGPVAGGKEILLFCDKVTKDDIQVRFYEEQRDGQVVWEALGDFQPSDVHKQYAITLKTPRYDDQNITERKRIFIELVKTSDDSRSDPQEFFFEPLEGKDKGKRKEF